MSRRARNVALAEWRAAAQRAADAGDYAAAKAALNQAIERDQKNASLRHNLGIVEEYLGNASAAASSYSTALRFDPDDRDAAAALVRLVTVASLDAAKLDPAGLKAALALDLGGTQALAAVSLRNRFAMLPELASRSASALLVNKTHVALQDALMLAALRSGTVCDRGQEWFFGGLRRVILVDTAPDRFHDRALSELVLALVQQGWNNDFAWAQTSEELDALERIELDLPALAAGGLEAARNLLLLALYRPLEQIPGLAGVVSGIRPKAARELFAERLRTAGLEAAIASELGGKTYLSTQEKLALFLVGRAFASGAVGPWTAGVTVRGKREDVSASGSHYRELAAADLAAGLTVTNTHQDPIFIELSYGGFPVRAPAALFADLKVSYFAK